MQALEQAARLAGLTRYLPALQLGVSTERDAEGTRVTGPELSVELPIFDQGQARLARLAATLRQAQARQAELEVDIRAEARTLRSQLLAARGIAEQYQNVLLPLRERIVGEAQRRYDAGLLGIYQLLLVRRDELDGYRGYLESIRDYWIARTDLERAVGGDLNASVTVEKKP